MCTVQRKSHGHTGAYVVFDDYIVESTLKETTRKCRTGGKLACMPHYQIEDDINFLSSTETKNRLTLYLAEKLVHTRTLPICTVTS